MDEEPSLPTVSIVIAAWNAEATILRAVRSVLDQEYPNRQVVVVDDGSTDRTAEVVAQLESPDVLLLRQENKGAATARNRGWRSSAGDYIHFLDADDVLLPGSIRHEVERALRSKTHPCYTYGGYTVMDENGRVFKHSDIPEAEGNLLDLFIRTESLFLPTICLLEREILDQTGGFDEELRYHEDRVFFLKVAKSFPAVAVPGVVAHYTQSVHGKARRSVANYTEALDNQFRMLSHCEPFLNPEEFDTMRTVTFNSLCARFLLYGHSKNAHRLCRDVEFTVHKNSPKGALTWLSLCLRINLLYPARRVFIFLQTSFAHNWMKTTKQRR